MIYLRLFFLEIKKYLKLLPLTIIGGLIPIAIIGMICLYGANYLYSSSALVTAHVALVTEDISDEYVDFALHYLSNMDSTSMTLEFDKMSTKEAYDALRNGDVIAVISFSNEELNGILYGDNIPVDITFGNNQDLSSVFLTELTRAGADYLAGAQASTYALSAIYINAGASDYLYKAYDDIDFTNFSYVLSRDHNFLLNNGDFGGTNSLILFYAGSGLMIFFILLGLAFAPCFAEKSSCFNELLIANKVKSITLFLYDFFAFFVCVVIYMSLIVFAILQVSTHTPEILMDININLSSVIHILCLSLFIAAYTAFIYSLSSKSHYGVLLLFMSSMLIAFISSSILPRAFMPMWITKIGRVTGLSSLHDHFVHIITGNHQGLFGLVIASLIFLVLGCTITTARRYFRNMH